MCEPDKSGSSDKTSVSGEKNSSKSESSKPQITSTQSFKNNLYSQVNSIIGNFKLTLKKYLNTNLKKPVASNELLKLISIAEKKITNFYGEIVKKVTDYAQNDLQKFKTISKEEAEKSKEILLEYAVIMRKISEEKLKKLVELKKRLQNRMPRIEEWQSLAKFFDLKMTEVKRLTEEIYKSLSKGEISPFVKDLQKMVETQSTTMKTSLNSFLATAKDNVPIIRKFLKSINREDLLFKIPTFSETFKLLSVSISKIFVQKKPQSVNGPKVARTKANKTMVILRNNLKFIVWKFVNSNIFGRNYSIMSHGEEAGGENLKGLARIFNSQTNYGRANVSRATLGSVALICAYFYLRPSKKPAPK